MSYPIDYSLISDAKMKFDNYYDANISNNNLTEVNAAVQSMYDLSENITNTLAIAPPHAGGYFNWISQVRTEDKQKIINEIEAKLANMFSHSVSISAPSLAGRATAPALPPRRPSPPPQIPMSNPAQNAKTQAAHFAVGFSNMSNNCWANALLSMIVCVPSLRQAYDIVANHYAQKNEHDPERKHGILLQQALKSYETSLSLSLPVPPQVSQDVRLVFHALFGHISLTGNQIFSENAGAQEDAHEALQQLMGKYASIIRNPQNSLYSSLITQRNYCPISEQREPLSGKFDYSKIGAENASSMVSPDYQILIDMQNNGHLSFEALLSNFFRNPAASNSEKAEYLLPNHKVQDFKLIEERRQFTKAPNEFILTLKRFGSDNYGNGFKINTPIGINRIIALPPEATAENKPLAYELDSFIVHSGEIAGGHYLCYKKIEDRWIEANDSLVRFVELWEIDQILHGQKEGNFTSYVHHYSRSTQPLQMGMQTQPSPSASSPAESMADVTVNNCTKLQLDAELAIKALDTLSCSIQNDSNCLKNVPSNMLGTFCHAIWLNGGVPNTYGYGEKELSRNPKKLLEVKFPWLIGKMGTTLLDQMLIIQKKKLEIASAQFDEALLKAFIEKVNNPARSNEELHSAFNALPKEIRLQFQGIIYHNHVKRFTKDYVHRHEYNKNNDYGSVALSKGDLRKILTEACDDSGVNSIEQLIRAYNTQAQMMQNAYEKEQLQAFRELLLEPSLTVKQLAKAFERLDINDTVKKNLYKAIWEGHNEPRGDRNYGLNTFTANPRCLLGIKKPILAGPPLCPAGSDILEQMIALLNKDSRLS